MVGTTAALLMGGAAAAKGIGGAIAAKKQSTAAKNAAQQQVDATNRASGYTQQGLNQLSQLYAPYVNSGAGAIGTIGRLTTPGPGAQFASPGPPNAMPSPYGGGMPPPNMAVPRGGGGTFAQMMPPGGGGAMRPMPGRGGPMPAQMFGGDVPPPNFRYNF